jgi:hypothetical protein
MVWSWYAMGYRYGSGIAISACPQQRCGSSKVFCRIKVLFSVTVATVSLWSTVQAQELETREAMAADCRELAQGGNVDLAKVRRCIMSCGSNNAAMDPSAAAAALTQCQSAHAEVSQGNTASSPVPVRTRSPAPATVAQAQVGEMGDMEGVYLQTTRSGFRVRIEGDKAWQTYCNEAARLETGSDEFSRTVKAYDRVRLIGITYDPTRAKDPVTRCMAKSAVILGPGSP